MISTDGFFGEEIITNLNERRGYILTHREETEGTRGILKWKNKAKKSEGVYFEPQEDGWFLMLEQPRTKRIRNDMDEIIEVVYENLYKASTDSYDKDQAAYSNSKGSWQCMKGFLNATDTCKTYVARITERPTTEEGGAALFYEHTAMGTLFYNAINLIEYSNLLIFQWYINHKLSHLLKERPTFVTSNWINKPTNSQRFGIDPSTKIYWLNDLKDFLTYDNIQKMNDLQQIDSLARYRYDPKTIKYNCDITITSALCVVLMKDEEELMAFADEEIMEPVKFISYSSGPDGSMQSSLNNNNYY